MTVTTGGAICGYCETAIAGITTSPAMRIMSEQTAARTGLLRKAFVTLGVPTEAGYRWFQAGGAYVKACSAWYELRESGLETT